MYDIILLQGDCVFYTGQKHRQELTKDGKPMKGWIHSAVEGQPGTFVVEFPEAKDSDYVMSSQYLSKYRPAKGEKPVGPEVQPRRQRTSEEDEKDK